MRVAIIGSGVSGIAAAKTLKRLGFDIVVYEKSDRIGGIWATAYPGVTLQNVAEHYRFTDFDWPFVPELHPTAEEVRRYLDAAVAHYGLDIWLGHKVEALSERADGWDVTVSSASGTSTLSFDYVVVANGHYSEATPSHILPGSDLFAGEIVNERELGNLDRFSGRRVLVVGFGKTAVDIASFAAERNAKVTHLFRSPRWLLPRSVFGHDISTIVPTRMSARMSPSWVHPWPGAKFMHRYLPWLVRYYWWLTELLFRSALGLHPFHADRDARRRIAALEPEDPLTYQMRAAVALAPPYYYASVVRGEIEPVKGILTGFDQTHALLSDGRRLEADMVVLAIGSPTPDFPFLPEAARQLMTSTPGGTQLYRHLIHPRLERLAFAGFNHGYFHIPAVEVATVWLAAVMAGDIVLPDAAEMEASAARVADWKARNMLFEPNRAHGIGGRQHHYLDTLLRELGVNPNRKSNAISDFTEPYWAKDYAGVADEYERQRGTPRPALPLDT